MTMKKNIKEVTGFVGLGLTTSIGSGVMEGISPGSSSSLSGVTNMMGPLGAAMGAGMVMREVNKMGKQKRRRRK